VRLRSEHDSYLAHWKAAGKPTLTATMPCCRNALEVAAPPSGRTWDSLITCPHCGALAMQVVTRDHVTMRRLPGDKAR